MGLATYDVTVQHAGNGVVNISAPISLASTTQDFIIDGIYVVNSDGVAVLQDGYTTESVVLDASANGTLNLSAENKMRYVRKQDQAGLQCENIGFYW